MSFISVDLDLQIRHILRNCGQQIEQMVAKQFEVEQKGPEDYVTNIDIALDRQLAAAFSLLCPGDGIITEENTASRKQFYEDYARLWCIDPLDGTEDFIQGKPDFALMVGMLQNHQPIAGWIYAPAYDHCYFGGSDWGVFQAVANQAPALLNIREPLLTDQFCSMIIGHRDQTRFGAAIAHYIPEAQFYSLGSFGLKVMEVILGRAGLYLYFNGRVKVWDTAGPLALAQAAGLVCCDLDGQAIRFSADAIASETLAHKQCIVIGWPRYIKQLLPKLQKAVEDVLQQRDDHSR